MQIPGDEIDRPYNRASLSDKRSPCAAQDGIFAIRLHLRVGPGHRKDPGV